MVQEYYNALEVNPRCSAKQTKERCLAHKSREFSREGDVTWNEIIGRMRNSVFQKYKFLIFHNGMQFMMLTEWYSFLQNPYTRVVIMLDFAT